MRFSTVLSTTFSIRIAVAGFTCSLLPARPVLAQQEPITVIGEMTDEDPPINPAGHPFDVYSFVGTAGTPVTITLSSSDYDTYMILAFNGENEAEEIARSNDMGPNDTNSELYGNLTRTGEYIVIMTTAESTGRGAYRLTIEGGVERK